MRSFLDSTVHELFERQASAAPNNIALRYQAQSITYDALNRRSNRVAHYLCAAGIDRGALVAVLLERSITAVSTILSILKVGAAYLPLDPSHPKGRLREIIQEASPSLILTTHSYEDILGNGTARLYVEDVEKTLSSYSEDNLTVDGGPDDLAYVIYTSGSTGVPKGVAGVHRSITNSLTWVPRDESSTGELWALNLSLAFGASLSRLFLPLLCGIPLLILSQEESEDSERLSNILEREGVTNIVLVTPLFRELLRSGTGITHKLSHLRTIVVGGSSRTPDLIDSSKRLLPHARIFDGYAITEVGGPVIVGQRMTVASSRIGYFRTQPSIFSIPK